MVRRTGPWILGMAVLLMSVATGCSKPETSDPPKEQAPAVTSPVGPKQAQEESEATSQDVALNRLIKRVNQIADFKLEGFERKGPPRSQISTVPPIWTGERLRGERAGSKLGEGASILFVSTAEQSLIMVDVAYVNGLKGTGILRTAWMDGQIAEKAGTCSKCTYHSVVQFYEPEIVYTVTAMTAEGPEKWLYRFTEGLMQYLRGNPLTE